MLTVARAWFNGLHINTQLMILITGLNLIDFQTTKILVDQYGFEAEVNPLMYNAMVYFDSVWGILVIKLIVLSVLWSTYNRVKYHHKLINPSRMTYMLGAITAGFFALITWNFSLVTISLLS